jgi:hypothetical protein
MTLHSTILLFLLHVLNNQEITTQELNESLVIIKAQKDKFKRSKKLNRLSIVASANDNGIVFEGLTEPYFGATMLT